MEASIAWEWLSKYWALLSGIATAVAAVAVYARKKVSERRMWKTHEALISLQAENPGLLLFEPRSLRERKLYEAMVEKGLLSRGLLPDQYQVRVK